MNGEDYDLWRCGICGEVREDDWGLQPVIDPDGWRHIACDTCRDEYPELQLADDGEMWANYPAPLVDDSQGLPFHLESWLHEE